MEIYVEDVWRLNIESINHRGHFKGYEAVTIDGSVAFTQSMSCAQILNNCNTCLLFLDNGNVQGMVCKGSYDTRESC